MYVIFYPIKDKRL